MFPAALAIVVQTFPLRERGKALIAAGIALSVLGFQQSQVWGWTNPATGLCIAAGLVLLVVFYVVEVRTPSPLMQMSMFRIRPFLVENLVLGVAMLAFVPVFFIGFVVASQIGGRMLDRIGAKRPVVLGCVLAAIVALAGLRSGRQEEPGDQPGEPGSAGQATGEDGAATVPPGRGS